LGVDGTANPYRSYSSAEQLANKETPLVSTGLQAIASEDTDEEKLARPGGMAHPSFLGRPMGTQVRSSLSK
jgi:hypothetical protein